MIGAALFGERIGVNKLAGVLIGLGGVAVLTRTGPATRRRCGAWRPAWRRPLATGWPVLTKRWIADRGGLDSRVVALGSQLGAVLLLLPFMLWQAAAQPLSWPEAGPRVWAALLALGLLCTALAYVLYFRLIADVGPLKALTVTFLIPPFGMFWSWLALGETVSGLQALGGALIALALWLVLRPEAPAARRRAG